MDLPSTKHQPLPERKSATARVLRVLGAVTFPLFLVAGVVRVAAQTDGWSSIGASQIGEFGGYLAAGLACSGFLWGVAALLRMLRQVQASLLRMEELQYQQRGSSTATSAEGQSTGGSAPGRGQIVGGENPAAENGVLREMTRLLRDIRDNSLLSEAERQEKARWVAEEDIHEAQALLRSLTAEGDFPRAREIAEKTSRRYPHDQRAADLIKQVEETRQRRESDDVESAVNQVNDLISISAWQPARQVVQQLQQRHPDSAEARQLLLRIEREHKILQDEQRRRMYAETQRYVTRRRWEEALAAARTFIERFPGCDEAEALQLQIHTLESNAEIEVRQRLEDEIMDLTKHGRYIEAVELAKKVITKYPESPQAEVLRSRLGRLEQLANDPDAPPARVRLGD